VSGLAGEPYVLADALCEATHPDLRVTMTGFVSVDGRFYVSCATCKSAVYAILPMIEAHIAARVQQARREAWDEGFAATPRELNDFIDAVKQHPNPYAEASS